jgi:hypothetical protein
MCSIHLACLGHEPATFGDQTRVVVHDLYPSKEALEGAIASGSTEGMPAQLEQLDELVVTLRGNA